MSSATGGYLNPTASQPLPGNLTLEQFIQTVIVGISGFTNTLVRPKWQVAPPKQPDINVNWIAFGLQINRPGYSAYVGVDESGDNSTLQRQEYLEIQLAFYGPNAQENLAIFQDGFQLQQNLEALRLANMGYTEISPGIRGPDLINERWVDRWECSLFLTRQVQRTYSILSFASAHGSIHTELSSEPYNTDWNTENIEEE